MRRLDDDTIRDEEEMRGGGFHLYIREEFVCFYLYDKNISSE